MTCRNPFDHLYLFGDPGFIPHVEPKCCCHGWFTGIPKHYEILMGNSLMELWNSPELRRLRLQVLKGDYHNCLRGLCERLPWGFCEGVSESVLAKMDNTGRLSVPPRILTLSFDYLCNLNCPTCRKTGGTIPSINPLTSLILQQMCMLDIPDLEINGAGEFSVNSAFLGFLENLTPSNAPYLRNLTLLTNGIAFTPECYHRFSEHAKSLIRIIRVSLDAASASTYKSVRKSSVFDKVLDNIRFYRSLPSKPLIRINMVVQRGNMHEIEDFVHLAARERLDGVLFAHVEDWLSVDQKTLSESFELTSYEREGLRDKIQSLREYYQGQLFILSDV